MPCCHRDSAEALYTQQKTEQSSSRHPYELSFETMPLRFQLVGKLSLLDSRQSFFLLNRVVELLLGKNKLNVAAKQN